MQGSWRLLAHQAMSSNPIADEEEPVQKETVAAVAACLVLPAPLCTSCLRQVEGG